MCGGGPNSGVGGGGGIGYPRPREAHPISYIVGRHSFPSPERSEDLGADRTFRKFCPPVVNVPPASEGGAPTAVPGEARQWKGGGPRSKRNGGEEREEKFGSQLNILLNKDLKHINLILCLFHLFFCSICFILSLFPPFNLQSHAEQN